MDSGGTKGHGTDMRLRRPAPTTTTMRWSGHPTTSQYIASSRCSRGTRLASVKLLRVSTEWTLKPMGTYIHKHCFVEHHELMPDSANASAVLPSASLPAGPAIVDVSPASLLD
eukprot:scaffold1318_cov388-Prasinococcus_capsulatus_cf.AAC.55